MLFCCRLCKTLQSIKLPCSCLVFPWYCLLKPRYRWHPDCHKISGWVLGLRSRIQIMEGLLNMEGVCFDMADGESLARCLSSWQGRDAPGRRGSSTVSVLSPLEETHLCLLPLPRSNTPIHHSPSPALPQGKTQCFAAIFLFPLMAVAVIHVALAGVSIVMKSLRNTASGRATQWVLCDPHEIWLKNHWTIFLEHNCCRSILKKGFKEDCSIAPSDALPRLWIANTDVNMDAKIRMKLNTTGSHQPAAPSCKKKQSVNKLYRLQRIMSSTARAQSHRLLHRWA